MVFGLLREEDQTFQRMVKNGMKSGRQEGSVLIFFLHCFTIQQIMAFAWIIMLHKLTNNKN